MIFYAVHGFIDSLGLTDTAISHVLSASSVFLGVSKKKSKKKNKGEGVTFTSEMNLCCIFKADVISREIMLRQEFS